MGVANGSCNLHSNRKLQLQLPFRPVAGQLATTSGVFRATWLCPANSPLGVAVCYIIHAKYVEKSPPYNIFRKDPLWGNIL